MTDLHSIGVTEESRKLAETVGPAFVREGLLLAREKSWKALDDIRNSLREGVTEREAFQLALGILRDHGAAKHWHKPYIRFGPGTALTFNDPLQKDYRLQPNDALYIDMGPVFMDAQTGIEYEGDVGDTFVFGENSRAAACIQSCHSLFQQARAYWKDTAASGVEVYTWLADRAHAWGYSLAPDVVGHRLSDYPHSRYSKDRLGSVEFHPSPHFWVLEVQLLTHDDTNRPMGAFFEDLLLED